MCCGLWHVTLLSTQSIWERCWQRQVSLQNIHVAIVSIPYRFKCLWCPSVKLHENQTHCETMGKDNKSIVVLVIWVDIFSSNFTVPPTLSTVEDVCTTFSSGETVKEASDTALLFAKGFEIVTLQITELLLTDSRVNVGSRDLVIEGQACISSCVKGPLEWRYLNLYSIISNNSLDALANFDGLLAAPLSQLDEVVSLGAIQCVISIAFRLTVAH
mmetsp:Transcript_52850/g.92816  ORF Transcript_52850/g.92816 Transcript_52850/m.92816 type:complete len:215 (-) Transcript_52850:190-834(-)